MFLNESIPLLKLTVGPVLGEEVGSTRRSLQAGKKNGTSCFLVEQALFELTRCLQGSSRRFTRSCYHVELEISALAATLVVK